MAQEIKARFRKKDGKITMINRKMWEQEINTLFKEDCDFIGTFRKRKKQRSTKQNSFYWAVTIPEVTEALVDAGYDRYMLTSETVHEFLVEKFLKFDLPSSEFAGEFISITKRSKELTTAEWMDYTTDIQRWAQTFLNTTLSVPEEQKELDLL